LVDRVRVARHHRNDRGPAPDQEDQKPLTASGSSRIMKTHTVYKTFNTSQRREFVRITPDVASRRTRSNG
jgi:hypothetical protein